MVRVAEPLQGEALSNAMSDLSAQVPEDDRQPSEVVLDSGAQMGVRINEPATIALNQ